MQNRSPALMAEEVKARKHVDRARRIRVSMSVVLGLTPDDSADAVIRDLSGDGFRLASSALLHPGQRITMRLPRETVGCEVRWVDANEAGGRFSQKAKPPQW